MFDEAPQVQVSSVILLTDHEAMTEFEWGSN